MISFTDVSKTYETRTVLRGINLEVPRGEMVFLTGPTGAGKSTLLKLLYAAEMPDEGDITIGDFHIPSIRRSQIPMLRQTIGVVFQDFKLLDNFTAFENIALALRVRGRREKEIRGLVADVLKSIQLRHKADHYPRSMSGGEQQRIVIARALVSEPLVLLADEPTGNLDPDTSKHIARLFYEANFHGTTVLIATHNRDLYRGTGKRVIKLFNGSIIGEEIG